MRLFAALFLALLMAAPAAAETRSAAQRKELVELARVLGESHALRQLCRSAEDQYWRDRMIALVVAEQPDPAFQDTLQASFRAGYEARRGQFTSCTPLARQAEGEVTARGAAIARRLAS